MYPVGKEAHLEYSAVCVCAVVCMYMFVSSPCLADMYLEHRSLHERQVSGIMGHSRSVLVLDPSLMHIEICALCAWGCSHSSLSASNCVVTIVRHAPTLPRRATSQFRRLRPCTRSWGGRFIATLRNIPPWPCRHRLCPQSREAVEFACRLRCSGGHRGGGGLDIVPAVFNHCCGYCRAAWARHVGGSSRKVAYLL